MCICPVYPNQFLEQLAFKYGTDKSKDDHKYTDVYESLFASIRENIFNVTEVGIAAGQSLQVWNSFFPNANIFGLDKEFHPKVFKNLQKYPRIHLLECNAYSKRKVAKINFSPNSMDLIIDDALHERKRNEQMLSIFFKYVKPNGYYVIEDIDAQRGGLAFQSAPEQLMEETTRILQDNQVMFIDAHVGHRDWKNFKIANTPDYTKDHVVHNSYMLVIRKRDDSPSHAIQINNGIGNFAMNPHKIVGVTKRQGSEIDSMP